MSLFFLFTFMSPSRVEISKRDFNENCQTQVSLRYLTGESKCYLCFCFITFWWQNLVFYITFLLHFLVSPLVPEVYVRYKRSEFLCIKKPADLKPLKTSQCWQKFNRVKKSSFVCHKGINSFCWFLPCQYSFHMFRPKAIFKEVSIVLLLSQKLLRYSLSVTQQIMITLANQIAGFFIPHYLIPTYFVIA